MLTQDDARRFADEWIAAWNAHDLDLIMSHYDDAIVLTSPRGSHTAELMELAANRKVTRVVANYDG